MPFYNRPQELAEPRSEVIDDEDTVNMDLNATAESGNEPEVLMTAMSASEFLAEIERLPTLRISSDSHSHEGNPSIGRFDIQEGEASRHYEGASEHPTGSSPAESPSPESPSGSWDSEFGELSFPSDDSFWNSYIPYESANPVLREEPPSENSERRQRILIDLCESTNGFTDLQDCSHGEDCEHDPYMACSQCCTCNQTVEVSMTRVLQLLNQEEIRSAVAARVDERRTRGSERQEGSSQFVS